MTHTVTTVRTRRVPLLAGLTLALAMGLALWTASPAAAFIDDSAEETAPVSGFDATGEGFIDSEAAGDAPGDPAGDRQGTHDLGHQAAPVGGISAGLGGMAANGTGLGPVHALAAGLLVLVASGLAAHRRRVRVGAQ